MLAVVEWTGIGESGLIKRTAGPGGRGPPRSSTTSSRAGRGWSRYNAGSGMGEPVSAHVARYRVAKVLRCWERVLGVRWRMTLQPKGYLATTRPGPDATLGTPKPRRACICKSAKNTFLFLASALCWRHCAPHLASCTTTPVASRCRLPMGRDWGLAEPGSCQVETLLQPPSLSFCLAAFPVILFN
jgi:hypothetical protein